ncbi:MAG: CAP domain-containing protein [Pirellulales bacterium]
MMKFKIVFAIVFLASLPIATSFAETSESTTSKSTSVSQKPPSTEHRLITAVNQYRARYKLPPLKADPVLMRVAQQRVPFVDARRSASSPGYNHHACGKWSRQHVVSAGFSGPATDNLAMGYESPEDAVKGWADEDRDRNPAGHNYQMRGLSKVNGRWINEGYNRVGVGIRGRNYIAIFGRGTTDRTN